MAGESESGEPDWVVPGLAPGALIAGYRVESRIGAGGMAMVLRAWDEALGRTVALKILVPALAGDAEFRERFIRESRAVAAVDHQHIIPVYAAGEANGVLYLAMRYVTGGDLRALIQREGPLPGDRAVTLLSPVASALDAAHAAGLVHRDVKPANILVDAGPGRPEHPYLSDFGLAKAAAASRGLTGTGQFLGTPDYAAPEQIASMPTGPQTDQYALACVAYTVLTGALPFPRDESMAVLWAHMYDRPPSLAASRPDLPSAADRVIGRALAKAPGDRYATCGAFIDALRSSLIEPPRTRLSGDFVSSRPVAGAAGWPRQPQLDTEAPSSRIRTGTPRRSALEPPELTHPGADLSLGSPSVPPVTPAARIRSPGRFGGHRAAAGKRRWPIVTGSLALLVLLLGGGTYGFWRYNQGQYYVGLSPSGFVSIFRGTNQSLAGISLSSLQTQTSLKASMLDSGDLATLRQTVAVSSLTAAQQRIGQLQARVSACQQTYQKLATWQTHYLAYRAYLAKKTAAAKAKPPPVVNSPGAMPTQMPSADQCAPSTAFGIQASALPTAGESAPPAPAVTAPGKSASPTFLPVGMMTRAAG